MAPLLLWASLAASVVTASREHQKLAFSIRDDPTFAYEPHLLKRDLEPCRLLAEAYRAADSEPGYSVSVDVPPSVGIACLKSVPLDKKRDLQLLDYLWPYVQFQTTLEILADPPKEYLIPGVDIVSGLDIIREKLNFDVYKSQYEFATELRSLFVAAADNHFDYAPALLQTIYFIRRDLALVSLSSNGLELPEIFMQRDIQANLNYTPSAIETIDGLSVDEFLEREAMFNTANSQDPDAQFNALFINIPGLTMGAEGTLPLSVFEIPDNHTIEFRNGSYRIIENGIFFPRSTNFSNIISGEAFHEAFEVPPTPLVESPTPTPTPLVESPTPTPTPGEEEETPEEESVCESPSWPKIDTRYPWPVEKHPLNTASSYFLNETEHKDVAVFSLLGFDITLSGFDTSGCDGDEFIYGVQEVFVNTVAKAKKEGRDKLIIDLSGNGGGYIALAHLLYSLLFPGEDMNLLDRYRTNRALEVTSGIDFATLSQQVLSDYETLPLNAHHKNISSGDTWFGPYAAAGQSVTAAIQDDYTQPWDTANKHYMNGFGPKGSAVWTKPPFKPENILILTDGACASACTIFTGSMTRNHGIRTVAVGGRRMQAPMQAMGGVKGSLVEEMSSLGTWFDGFMENYEGNVADYVALVDPASEIPTTKPAPLLEGAAGRVNARNAYTVDRLNDYPVHFRYEAANCRLFYTPKMHLSPAETWRRAADVAWRGAKCVKGSTSNANDTMGDEPPRFNETVRGRAPGIKGPGSLGQEWVEWLGI